MADNNFNYSGMNYPKGNMNNIIKNQEITINELKRTIQVYEKNSQDQIRKLSKLDSLLIEYNSLLKNYSELERELAITKNENIQLKNIINSKNQTISDYQNLVLNSKSKFELFERNNNSLKLKVKEQEKKLSNLPLLEQNNNELKLKLVEYENKIKLLKEEFNKKEELFNIKLGNQEKITKSNIRNFENDIEELNTEIKNLKNQLQIFQRRNDEIISQGKSLENDYKMKLKAKEREIEKLSKNITDIKTNMNDNILSNQSQMMNNKNIIEKLKKENSDLLRKLDEYELEISELNQDLSEADNYINQMELKLHTGENKINALIQEKESLLKQLNEKQLDFNQYQNSTEEEINILNAKINDLENEKNILINKNENQINEIVQLKNNINQYLNDDKIHFEECRQADQKYNNLAKNYKNKEKEYSETLAKLNVLNNNLRVELELIKSKYEKKIQDLMLNNNELNSRVKNLIKSLIALKDYALSIERNMNEAQNFRNSNFNKNNDIIGKNNYSMIIKNNNSFMNDELGNSRVNNNNRLNLTNQEDYNDYNYDENNKKNKDLLNSMKNMLNHIDEQIYDDKDEF